MGKASEIWKEIKPKVGEMLMAVNNIETQAEKAQEEAFKNGYDAACKDIDIKSKTSAAYQKGYQDATAKISSDEQAIAEKVYQSGLNDAWEVARKIVHLQWDGAWAGVDEVEKWFDTYSASEAIEKIRQYEQEQKEKITKGDVVRIKSAPEVEILVTCADGGHVSRIALTEVDDNCKIGDQYTDIVIHNVEKTGRHYEIAEVLQKMKESANDN